MIQYSWDQAYFSDGISISIQHLLVKQIQTKRTREACILKHMSKVKEQKPTERNKISQSGRVEQSRAELMEIHYPVAEETSSARPSNIFL